MCQWPQAWGAPTARRHDRQPPSRERILHMCGEQPEPQSPPPVRGGTRRPLGLPAAVVAAGLVLGCCAAFVGLAIQFNRASSATIDETGFLTAGYTYVRW